MARLFILLLLVTLMLIFMVGGAVYWSSSAAVNSVKVVAANDVAKSISLNVSGQIRLLNMALNSVAQQPEVVTAVMHANPAALESVANTIQSYFPQAMKIRLLLPGVNKVDESAVPHMGYADLDMVRETFIKTQPPAVQGDIEANRHLAMTSQVIQDGKVIGVVLASLRYNFIAATIKTIEADDYYIELKQDTLVLGKSGVELSKNHSRISEITVPHTAWKVYCQYTVGASLMEIGRFWGCITFAVVIALAAFFLGYRRLSKLLKSDLGSVFKAFKDIVSNKPMGSYPVNLPEMNIVISSFMRLNRAMKDTAGNIKDDEDDLEKSGFFSTPDDFDFSDMALDDTSSDEEELFQNLPVEHAAKREQPSVAVVAHIETFSVAEPKSTPAKIKAPKAVKLPAEIPKQDATAAIFKAYDIRGIVGKTLTMNMVYDIGRAFGSAAKSQGCETVAMGRDGRISSPALAEELAKGITSTGCSVIDLGMVPTPVLYFATQYIEGRTGIMITGSHNPPDYNGFKMVLGGETLSGERVQTIKNCIDSRSYITGDMGLIEKNTKLATEYVGTIAEDIRISRPMLVVLDCGNGVGGKLGPALLKALGCEVIELHCEIDGNFPNHHPDPSKPENMVDLIGSVKHYKADLGLAFDGDADRLGVVDSNGKIIWPDRQMMLFAKHVLSQKPAAEVIFDVKCSKNLAVQIKKYGGRPLMWKTGHSLMKAKIKENNAILAGEMSGHIFFNDRWFGFDDALYAAARLIEILSNEQGSSAQVFAQFPDSINTPELTIDLEEGEGAMLIESMRETADFIDATVIDIDGLRVEFSDGWGLVRASNTTPSLTLRFEADSQEAMEKIQQRFRHLINTVKPGLDLPF